MTFQLKIRCQKLPASAHAMIARQRTLWNIGIPRLVGSPSKQIFIVYRFPQFVARRISLEETKIKLLTYHQLRAILSESYQDISVLRAIDPFIIVRVYMELRMPTNQLKIICFQLRFCDFASQEDLGRIV